MGRKKKTRTMAIFFSVLLVLSTANPALAANWTDGSYTVAAEGRGGQVEVTVQLKGARTIPM